jgi:F-type H+-transporting ATPase subunit a
MATTQVLLPDTLVLSLRLELWRIKTSMVYLLSVVLARLPELRSISKCFENVLISDKVVKSSLPMNHTIAVSLKAELLGHIFGLPVTNSIVMTWIVMVILIAFAFFFGRSLKMIPGKFQAAVEFAFEGAFEYISTTLESEALARRFFPLLATIFLFVLVGNELEFFPGVGSIGFFHGTAFIPLLRAPAADLNLTLALAFIAFFTIEITGIATLGGLKYASKFVNLKSPIGFVVGLIEIISNLGRIISFSFRLFGNIFAGEVMILVAMYFLPYILPVPLIGFEMFVGAIQALVFAMLTLFFIKLSITDPHESH